ncbi:uncharacterized protein [Drosophila takahashii]|uniref:uncharacterized protein n=1 Tax=Drosophila takahashii TaxID=29030 RepID=UPI001CF8CB8D|nr:extensin [Drosophila takahashii]
MCNLFRLSACFLAVCLLPFALSEANATSVQKDLKSEPKDDLVPTAEKLIRYRRQPPYSVIKRSKQRRRTKGPPKIKYGPPPPHIRYSSKPSFPSHHEEPSFSLDDFQHLKFDGSDFKIPTSSYEAQSMDLDFYNHDTEPDLYGAHKFPSLDFGLVTTHEHVPHQKYGLPEQSFQPDHSFASHYEPPPAPPAHIPSTKYGVPTAPVAVPSYSHQDLPSPDSYSIYEQKIPNVGYHQNFAEPPKKPHKHGSNHNPNFEIAYSPPAFEISTSYQSNHQQSYVPPHPSQPHEGFAEPPANNYVKPAQHPPANSYAPPQHPSAGYEQPPQHPSSSYDHPPQHPSSSYDHPSQHPSSSYDHPPSHPSSTYDQPPQHPSSSYDHPPSSYNQPSLDHPSNYQHPPSSSYDQPPQHPPTNYISSDSHSHSINSYPQDDYAPPTQELPLNPHHKFPSFDFPKSSYEVPIYDPVPFEASNRDEQESYPPILVSSPDQNEITSDAHASGSSKRRKRKRKPSGGAAGNVPAKHTLDVPELQQAYDADSHSGESQENADTDTNSSHFVERKQTFYNFVTPTTTTTSTTPAPWSPMRGRSSTTRVAFVPTIVTSTPGTPTTTRSRNRGSSRYRQQPVNPSSPDPNVRIDQSHSQSYYDGTIAPPTRQKFTPTTGGRGGSRPTRPGYVRNHGPVSPLALQPANPPTSKRTTKGVFDTTLFKSPLSDREMLRQNLPKNHKLF